MDRYYNKLKFYRSLIKRFKLYFKFRLKRFIIRT